MTFPLNAYLLALWSGFLATFLTLPLWRRWCLRVGLVDEPGHRKIHAAPVPLAGGLAVLTGLSVPLLGGAIAVKLNLLGINTAGLLSRGLSRRAMELIAIVLGGYQFAHGEPGAKKALAGVAAGTGIAVLATNVLTWLWGI